MRIHTRPRYRIQQLAYLLILASLLSGLILMNLPGSWSAWKWISLLAFALIFFLVYRGLPVFDFDSDGEVLILTAKEPFLQPFSPAFVKHTEFPKRKLKNFEIERWPLRRTIALLIESKDGSVKKVRIPASYLRRIELRDVERSLRGVLKRNNELQNSKPEHGFE